MTVDRAGCDAARHGDHNAYRRGCRCPDAREDRRLYYKRWHEGRLQPGMVPAIGAARRLQALAALGWSLNDLAPRLGAHRDNIQRVRRGNYDTMTRQQYDRITAVYDQLQGTPGPSQSARSWADRFGWAPPLAWDDDNRIDDPAAQPDRGQPAPRGVDLGEVRWLTRAGVPLHEAAARVGVKPESIERARFRAQAREAVERARAAIATNPVDGWQNQPETRQLEVAAR